MLKISNAVEQLVASSDFAIEGLRTGSLNLSKYASLISDDVQRLTMKPVRTASIVVTLSRLAKKYHDASPAIRDFKLRNLVSRSGLTELAYDKTGGLQHQIVRLLERQEVIDAPFCVMIFGLAEVSIVTDGATASLIRDLLADYKPSLWLPGLSSLTMQVDRETIDTPGQSYAVIRQIAVRDITIVEYITSPTELTIILYDRDLKESFVALHDTFFRTI